MLGNRSCGITKTLVMDNHKVLLFYYSQIGQSLHSLSKRVHVIELCVQEIDNWGYLLVHKEGQSLNFMVLHNSKTYPIGIGLHLCNLCKFKVKEG